MLKKGSEGSGGQTYADSGELLTRGPGAGETWEKDRVLMEDMATGTVSWAHAGHFVPSISVNIR